MQDGGFDTALGASYRLEERLGQGAMGEVWSAVDRRTNETVAAKLLRSEHVADQDLVSRFLRERAILTGLRHDNLVRIRDLVVEGDRLAIVMDYVDGGSLRDIVTAGEPLTPAQAVDLSAAVLDGLAAAHDKGVLHRDIKPDNVLLARDWHDLRPGDVKLTDFGIARIVAEGVRTTTGLLGTPEYMCPELIATGGADLPADVYGVGILLYELLAGRTPFAGPGTDYTVAHRHVTSEPPVLPVPDELWAGLAAMLDKDPSARPTARAAASTLRSLRPSLADVPALERQQAPESFGSAQGPATVVRGLAPTPAPAPVVDDPDGPQTLDDLQLGTPENATIVRPMERPAQARPERPATAEPPAKKSRPVWRDPRAIGLTVAALVLLGGGVAYAAMSGGDEEGGGDPAGPAQSDPRPGIKHLSGLEIERTASYDPDSESVQLTITYSAQAAPLRGPYVEVLPGLTSASEETEEETSEDDEAACASPDWGDNPDTEVTENLSGETNFTEPCAWSIQPPDLEAQGSAQVTATIPMRFEGDSKAAINEWLAQVEEATTALVESDTTSDAYTAQRLTGVEVDAPDRVFPSTKPLAINLFPVYPSGRGNQPLYTSTSIGDPSSVLQDIAGDYDGIRFEASCSDAVRIDGLQVFARQPTESCELGAQVGTIDAQSYPISIGLRDS